MNYFKYLTYAVVILSMAGCGNKRADGYGRPKEGDYRRIISLAPSITEDLFLLGLGERVVGVTSYCTYPANLGKIEIIGSLLEPNIEKIAAAEPDLIVATYEDTGNKTIQKLRDLGFEVLILKNAKNFEDISGNLTTVAKMTAKTEKAEALIKKAKKELLEITGKIRGRTKKTVFVELGTKPLVTAADGTYLNEIIILAGGINISGNAPGRYPIYSIEEVVKQDPDLIIIVTMGNVTGSEKTIWNNYRALKAVKEDGIHIVEADTVCRPNVASFMKTLRLITALIHPEIPG